MEDIVAESLSSQRLQTFMVSFFAVSALLLSILGVYGVVSIRSGSAPEIGTRMALGATSARFNRAGCGRWLEDGRDWDRRWRSDGARGGADLESTGLRTCNSPVLRPLSCNPALTSTGLRRWPVSFPGWRVQRSRQVIAIRNEPDTMWARISSNQRWAGKLSEWTARPEEHTGELELLTAIVDSSRRAVAGAGDSVRPVGTAPGLGAGRCASHRSRSGRERTDVSLPRRRNRIERIGPFGRCADLRARDLLGRAAHQRRRYRHLASLGGGRAPRRVVEFKR